jgi:hypothetical protein
MSDTVRQPQAESAEVMSEIIAGVEVPETAAVAEATRLVRETISPLIYDHEPGCEHGCTIPELCPDLTQWSWGLRFIRRWQQRRSQA